MVESEEDSSDEMTNSIGIADSVVKPNRAKKNADKGFSNDIKDVNKDEESVILEKAKPLSNEQIEEMNQKVKQTGVVYLSTIPPGMNWPQVMQHLKLYGEINRSHLRKADVSPSQRRKSPPSFVEGWVEFVDRKDAKMCVSQLNGRIVGGKKSSKFHDYIWNMKYLHGFKWPQLLELMNYEKHLRADKLKSEFTKLRKQDEKYLENVSRSEMRKRKLEKDESTIRPIKKSKKYRVCI